MSTAEEEEEEETEQQLEDDKDGCVNEMNEGFVGEPSFQRDVSWMEVKQLGVLTEVI